MSERSVHWSVTINNPKPDDEENIAMARQRGWVVEGQKEVGENGTPHYQLMVNTRTQQRFTALKKAFPRGHIEAARNPKALKQYVHKEETKVSELTISDRYVTSQKRLWELIVDYLEGCDADKKYRIVIGEDSPYSERFDPLEALDHAVAKLIRDGWHGVESMAVNPQVRSAWQKFCWAIVYRRQKDRQTDRQDELISQHVDIPTADGEDDEGSVVDEGDTCSEESEDYETGSCSSDEGCSEGGSSECSEEDVE